MYRRRQHALLAKGKQLNNGAASAPKTSRFNPAPEMDTKKKQLAAPADSANGLARHECLYKLGAKHFVIHVDVDAHKSLAQAQTNARTRLRAGERRSRCPIRQQSILAAADIFTRCLFVRDNGQRTKPKRLK
jgi:hypothetical protein